MLDRFVGKLVNFPKCAKTIIKFDQTVQEKELATKLTWLCLELCSLVRCVFSACVY